MAAVKEAGHFWCADPEKGSNKPLISLVGPAGLPHSKECKHLAGAETVGNPDISRCLSQPSVSLGTEGGIDLHIGRRYTGVSIRPDFEWPGMWRVHQGDRVSDMTNLSRAKDAGITCARPRGLGSSELAR